MPPQIDSLRACRHVFARKVAAITGPPAGQFDQETLRFYFRARSAVERKDVRSLSVADINRYRELLPRVATPAVERLFVSWQALGESALTDIDCQLIEAPAPQVRLVEYTLPFAYEQFGSLPGLA